MRTPLRLLPLLALSGCFYNYSSYVEDVLEAHCLCIEPSQQDACVDETIEAFEDAGILEACGDQPAPASWREMLQWRSDYTAECDLAKATPPGAGSLEADCLF